MTRRKALSLIVYAPPLVGQDGRTLAIVRGMEKALPGLRLEWEVGKGVRPIALPQRDAWLAERTQDGRFPLLCNGDERYPVTVNGRGRPGLLSPGSQSMSEVHAELPLDEPVLAAAAALLEGVAEGACSFWGHASPYGYGSEVAPQFRRSSQGPECSPRGLPMINLPEKLPAPEIPWFLGWLNHWSAAAARAIGFPDPTRDAELLSRARRTASGGWVVQLTDAPLDLDKPAHLDTLKRTYERFPEIGGRAAP
ncbi:hypothetical protein HJC22_32640 [Corallococcus exiguus]|uniref:DUF5953 family protein n=1 Tax=Corallococcus exiguus TaxID=83462 RepID=UPI0014713A86|nr:DUF5953 family protein [Corallococcus exiguus]NNC20477.1 hypothetical protein [Corallococcus exiguus]